MKKYTRNISVTCQRIDDQETVLLHPKIQRFFSLNTTAASIWEKIDRPRTKEEIIDAMLNEYAGSKETIKTDVENIIKRWVKSSLAKEINVKR